MSQPTPTPEDAIVAAADAQAEAAARAQRTGAAGADFKAAPNPETEREIDAIFKEVAPSAPAVDDEDVSDRLEGETREDAPAPAPAPAPEPEATPAPAPEPTPAPAPDGEPKTKTLLDELLESKEAKPADPAPAPAPDPYEEHKLRSDASPKTRETFENVKKIAREREQELQNKLGKTETEMAELRKQLEEAKKSAGQPSEETLKELNELRAMRAQFDTESDPTFKQKYDDRIAANYEAIYATLAEHGLKQETLAELKAMSPEDRDYNIDRFLTKLTGTPKKLIEAKLIDSVTVAEQRKRELEQTRANASRLLEERKKQAEEAAKAREAKLVDTLRPVLPKLDWLHPKEVPADATPEQRKALEEHNAFATKMSEKLATVLIDDSPEVRAQAALGLVMASHYRRQFDKVSAALQAAEEKLKKVASASKTSRMVNSIASPAPAPAVEKREPRDSADAVDALFLEATGTRGDSPSSR